MNTKFNRIAIAQNKVISLQQTKNLRKHKESQLTKHHQNQNESLNEKIKETEKRWEAIMGVIIASYFSRSHIYLDNIYTFIFSSNIQYYYTFS